MQRVSNLNYTNLLRVEYIEKLGIYFRCRIGCRLVSTFQFSSATNGRIQMVGADKVVIEKVPKFPEKEKLFESFKLLKIPDEVEYAVEIVCKMLSASTGQVSVTVDSKRSSENIIPSGQKSNIRRL